MKRKNLLLTFLLAALAFGGVKAQETVTIGTGTSGSYQIPFTPLQRYQISEMIYNVSSMDQSENKTITSIAFDYINNTNYNGSSFGIDIYMKNTDQSSFSTTTSWVLMSEDDKVFSGTVILPSGSGWLKIELDDEFEYNYTKNLVIAFNKTTKAGASSYTSIFNTTTNSSTSYSLHYGMGSAASAYDPSTISSIGTLVKGFPNIQITFKDESTFPVPTGLTASPIKTYAATLTWDMANNATSYNVKYRETSSTEWATEMGIVSNSLEINNLTDNTGYEAQIQAVYSEGNSEWSSVYSFTTLNLLRYTSTTSYQSWSSSTAWTPNEIPTANHDVVIEQPAKVSSGNAFANNITINSGATLNIQAQRALTCNQITNNGSLVIADGGQLICNNAVQATMQKNITGYGGDNTVKTGWYFIASPVNYNPAGTNLLSNTYDLFLYDEAQVMWRNYEQAGNYYHFSMEHAKGYLYANSEDTELSFAGLMPACTTNVAVDLSYSSGASMPGFNLVGNPFTNNLTGNVTIGGNPLSAYSYVEGGSEILSTTLADRAIKPTEGFLVQATDENQQLIFNPSSKGETAIKPSFIRIEAGDEDFMDRAYVQIGSGNTLRKMTINDNVSHVYVMSEGKDYAAATIQEARGEMPVNFKANENGQYTITVNPENVEMDYLHLVDNITGTDIDLLATPSYTFNAKTTDYASRFRLLFAANGIEENGTSTSSANFAFISNGQLIVNGTGTLQIIDMTGRVVSTKSTEERISTNELTPGVYVVKLMGNETKTQKIVIE